MFNIKTLGTIFIFIVFFLVLFFLATMPPRESLTKESYVVKPGYRYKHFKGNEYVVVCIAHDTEDKDLKEMVVYQDLNNEEKIWVRPMSMFTEKVDKDKYPTVEQEYRFERIAGSQVVDLNINSTSRDGSVKSGYKYKHFKGNEYVVVCIAHDTEDKDLREMVVYQDLNNEEKIWVRPMSMFTEKVDKDKYPTVEQEYRFERIIK